MSCLEHDVWLDVRIAPVLASAISILLLLWQELKSKQHASRECQDLGEVDGASSSGDSLVVKIGHHVQRQGGYVVCALQGLRVLGNVALSVLYIQSAYGPNHASIGGRLAPRNSRTDEDCGNVSQVGLAIAFMYTSCLAICSTWCTPRKGRQPSNHADLMAFIQFLIFVWRNLLPLTTINGTPADDTPGKLLWLKGILVVVVGLLVPGLMAQPYIPANPENPSAEPNPEQTASILSFVFYAFLERLVWTAYATSKMTYDSLPPLADYDWSSNLESRTRDNLDPVRRRELGLQDQHLFIGLGNVFGWDYLRLAILLVFDILSRFVAPFALNHLLSDVETAGRETDIRPWAWALLLFLGAISASVTRNTYIFLSTRFSVQCENVLTQVLFQHALRVRITGPEDGLGLPQQELAEPDSDTVSLDAAAPPTEEGTESQPSSSHTLLAPPAPPQDEKLPHQPSPHLAGKINTLFGTDIKNVLKARDFLVLFLMNPLEISIGIWFLYGLLSWAAIVGLVVMIATLPLPGLITKQMNTAQADLMTKTEERVQFLTEVLGVVRMLKMFGWESMITQEVAYRRDTELRSLKRQMSISIMGNISSAGLVTFTMISTFAFYTLMMKQELDASRVFSSIVVFSIIQEDFMGVSYLLNTFIQAKVSLERLNVFLHKSALLDRYRPTGLVALSASNGQDSVVGFHKATFTWGELSADGSHGSRTFSLRVENLLFQPEAINIISGPTGCGKTSLLMALLGEMHFEPSDSTSWYYLPRSAGVAYVPQESWVFNNTIKQNILFGEPYEAARYHEVIHGCALEADLASLAAGDETEVGEGGITLSGGQRARVTLARAMYSQAKTLLIDDVFAALDVHTARRIATRLFHGGLLLGRTVLLTTHNTALLTPFADQTISFSKNGFVVVHEQSANDRSPYTLQAKEDEEEPRAAGGSTQTKYGTSAEAEPNGKSAMGALIGTEEMAEGRLNWGTASLILRSHGGLPYWTLILAGLVTISMIDLMYTWWLGVWATAYERQVVQHVNVVYFFSILVGIAILKDIVYSGTTIGYVFGSVRASGNIHNQLMDRILGTTFHWYSRTPVGRIIARLTQDIGAVDGLLPTWLLMFLEYSFSLLMKFGAIVVFSPVFLIPSVFLVVAGVFFGQVFINVQHTVRRMVSNYRSPLYNHFGATVSGLVSIRAYGAETVFKAELFKRLDAYCRPSRTYHNLDRWISTRADLLGALFSSSLAVYLLYARRTVGAGNAGFSLSLAIRLSGILVFWVRLLNEVELSMNSVERIREYLLIEQEPRPTDSGTPPAYWPSSGAITVDRLCARYTEEGPAVLNDLCFEIKSGERIGVVGRTGSGKTSLALSLLRLIPTTGAVRIDNIPTGSVNLDALRLAVALIPQEPALISGTLRRNVSPGESSNIDDAILNDALRAVGLIGNRAGIEKDAITLDSIVASGGSNFSVGERQLIALARAIVRRTKILILDEATASVDEESDATIQRFIREKLQDVTLITIAHRLHTIMDYDKIMVLDSGKLAEYDSPLALLADEKSMFRALVENSGEAEKLWDIASAKGSS